MMSQVRKQIGGSIGLAILKVIRYGGKFLTADDLMFYTKRK